MSRRPDHLVYCDSQCHDKAFRAYRLRIIGKDCRRCGRSYAGPAQSRYCSALCSRAQREDYWRERYSAMTPEQLVAYRARKNANSRTPERKAQRRARWTDPEVKLRGELRRAARDEAKRRGLTPNEVLAEWNGPRGALTALPPQPQSRGHRG